MGCVFHSRLHSTGTRQPQIADSAILHFIFFFAFVAPGCFALSAETIFFPVLASIALTALPWVKARIE
jgi:hypothetical protein